MRKALVLIFSCALILMVACGGGNDGSSAGGNPITPPSSGNNVVAVVVDPGPSVGGSQIGYTNGLFVTVTVCVPGTSTCQTIDHVLVDTGSMGLRVLDTAMTLPLPQQTDGSGNSIAECNQFLDGFTWGPVQQADIIVGGETAKAAAIQVISEAQFAVPSGCSGTNEDTLQGLAANGILGIGPFLQDCGTFCVTNIPSPALYYTCSASACNGTTQPLASQLQNPVSMFPTDNNGTIIELQAISNTGAPTVNGSLVFGIGTQSNNGLKGALVLTTDNQGDIATAFNGQQYTGSFIDSGSNGIFFLDSGTTGIPTCPGNDSAFYCPGAPSTSALNQRNLTATNIGSNGLSGDVNFSIANAEFLFTTNGGANFAFNDLGGPNTGSFDWGLPFFFGRNVITAIENQNTPAGIGPTSPIESSKSNLVIGSIEICQLPDSNYLIPNLLELLLLQPLAQWTAQVAALQGKLNRRFQEAELVASIVALPFKAEAVDFFLFQQLAHAICELYFTACTQLRPRERLKNPWRQNISSNDRQVRRRFRSLWLFHQVGNLKKPPIKLSRHLVSRDHAVQKILPDPQLPASRSPSTVSPRKLASSASGKEPRRRSRRPRAVPRMALHPLVRVTSARRAPGPALPSGARTLRESCPRSGARC